MSEDKRKKFRARDEHGKPDPVDVYVGARIRLRRTLMGLGQIELAARIKLTFQQLQKYENGVNRVSASRLYHIALALDVPVSFFFDGFDETHAPSRDTGRLELSLLSHFSRMSERARRVLVDMAQVLDNECPKE